VNLVSWSWNPDILAAEESVFARDAEANRRAFNRLAEEEGLRELSELVGIDKIDGELDAFAGEPFVADADGDDEKPKLYIPVFAGHATTRILAPPELTVARVRRLAVRYGDGDADPSHEPWRFAGPALACLAADNRPEPEKGLFVLLLLFCREHGGVTEWACDAHVITSGFTVERESDYEILRTAGAWRLHDNLEALAAYQGLYPWEEWEPWGDHQP
jgi:hypothetical protein